MGWVSVLPKGKSLASSSVFAGMETAPHGTYRYPALTCDARNIVADFKRAVDKGIDPYFCRKQQVKENQR